MDPRRLNGACTRAIGLLVDAGPAAEGLDVSLEPGRLHAPLDGLALHAVMRPAKVPPSRIKAVIARRACAARAGAPWPSPWSPASRPPRRRPRGPRAAG